MRIIDDRTGAVGVTVSTPEEALLALSADSEERLARGLRNVWHHVHPDDAAVEGDDDEDDVPERRTVQVVAKQRPGVLAAALDSDCVYRRRRELRWSMWDLRFDPFNDTNVMEWPRRVSELRGEAALAEATIGELAAHLNAGLRGDLAALLGDCADFVDVDDVFGRGDGPPQTVWDRFRFDSDLYEFDVKSVAAAIAGGPARWDAVDDWTPAVASTATPMRCAALCGGRWVRACSSLPRSSSSGISPATPSCACIAWSWTTARDPPSSSGPTSPTPAAATRAATTAPSRRSASTTGGARTPLSLGVGASAGSAAPPATPGC